MSERIRLTSILFPISLALAWIFDFLFWGKAHGIAFPIFVVLSLAAGFWMARSQGIKPAARSLWLLLPIAFFGAMSILRLEDFSLFLSRAFTFLFMALLAVSFMSGRWTDYGLSDYVAKLASFVPIGLSTGRQLQNEPIKPGEQALKLNTLKSVGTGLLLAAPLLWLLGALLASADQFFAQWLSDVFSFLDIEKLAEYLFRGFYILVLTYILVGVFAYALTKSRDEKLLGEDQPLIKLFLGFTEAATILVSVELLFLAFVTFQIRYFFGGGANINTATYTYAEYARRGFGEMVAAVVIAVALFAALSTLSRRQEAGQKQWFSWLGVGLLAFVAVMLVSAYQRLLLYESAYGFTRARIFAHTFMIWVGVLLLALVVLEVQGRSRAFTLAAVLAALGFAASLNLLNVDAFIVRANVERMTRGRRLDVSYLASLSEDALPQLIQEYQLAEDRGQASAGEALLAALACHALDHDNYPAAEAWQSMHLSRSAASQAWSVFQAGESFKRITFPDDENELTGVVQVGERKFKCWQYRNWD